MSTASFRELLEQSRDAFNARDPEAWLAAWNPDCEWHPYLTAREEGDPGYHGPQWDQGLVRGRR